MSNVFEGIKTKDGHVIWLKMCSTFGRHEIARWEFASFERRKEREKNKSNKGNSK